MESGMFSQKGKDFTGALRGEAVDVNPSEQSGSFAVKLGKPVWRQFVGNKDFQESQAGAIRAERDYQARVERGNDDIRRQREADAKAQQAASKEKWGGDNGRLFRQTAAGVEEFDAEQYAEDANLGGLARKSLFDRELRGVKSEAQKRKAMLGDPNDKRALSERERAEIESEIGFLSEQSDVGSQAQLKEQKAKLAKADERRADEKAAFDLEMKAMEYGNLTPDDWYSTNGKKSLEEKRQAALAGDDARAREVVAADESAAAEMREIDAKLAQGVRGSEVEGLKAQRAELAAGRVSIAEERNKLGAGREAVRGEAVGEIAREKRAGEAEIRTKLFTRGATPLAGKDRNIVEKVKGNLNSGASEESQLSYMVGQAGGREKARERLKFLIGQASKSSPLTSGVGFGSGTPSPGQDASEKYRKQLALLEAQDAEFAKAGVNDPAERERLFADAVKENEWTASDADNVRQLSTGEVAINPARVYGQYERLVAEIKSTAGSPADAQEGIARLDALRTILAEQKSMDAWYGDTDFRKHATAMEEAGVEDKVQILDAYAAKMKDRNRLVKFGDALITGYAEGGASIYKTGIGGAAGIAALVGADGAAATLGTEQQLIAGAIADSSSGSDLRGQTGGYGLTKELSTTVTQMAPMFIGGAYAQGLKGMSRVAVGGLSVYGWAAAQGYESKLADAVDIAQAEAGDRKLTPDEIAGVLRRGDTQAAAFLNGAQTAILAKVLGKGVERAALGQSTGSMTVRDFLSKGGREALRDSTLRKELVKMGKTIFADATDEFVEEGLNQFFDGIISTAVLDQEMLLGDLVEESVKAGAMGAIVGGGIPQVRRTPKARPADPLSRLNTRIVADDPGHDPASEPEVARAVEFVQDPNNVDDLADAVLAAREIDAVEFAEDEAMGAAEAAVLEAQSSGDPAAVKAAEGNRDAVRKTTGKAVRARAVLKLTSGGGMADLTDAEARSIGFDISGAEPKPLKGKDLEAQGLTKPLVRPGADGSAIVLDEALKGLEAVSPRARARVGMTEAQAIRAAAKAAADAASASPAGSAPTTPATPTTPTNPNAPRRFTVGLRSGGSMEVEAMDEAGAEQEAAATATEQIVPGSAVAVAVQNPPSGAQQTPLAGTNAPQGEGKKLANGEEPNDSGVFVSGGEQIEYKGKKAGATINVAQLDDGQWIVAGGYQHNTGNAQGVGEALNVNNREKFPTREAAIKAFAKNLAIQNQGLLVDGSASDTQKKEAKNIIEWAKGLIGVETTSTPAADPKAPGAKAKARVKKYAEDLKKGNPRLANVRITEDSKIRAQANEDGSVDINLSRLVDEAMAAGMNEGQAGTFAARALDEEIRHMAQYAASRKLYKTSGSALTYEAWRAEYYGAIWQNDFLGNPAKAQAVAKLYGKEGKGIADFNGMEDWRKAFEAIRMMSQGRKSTEAATLWANISTQLRAALEAALEAMKTLVANPSPTLRAEIAALEEALAQIKSNEQGTGNTGTDGKKPAQGKKADGNGGKTKAGSNRPTGDSGTANPAPSGAPAGAIAPGTRVIVSHSEGELPGVVQLVRSDGQVVKVKLDAPLKDGRDNLALPIQSVTPVAATSAPQPVEDAPENPAKPNKRRSISSPARRGAQALLDNPDTIQTIANLIDNVGKIPRPNAGMLRIVSNLRSQKNLTDKQRKFLEKYQDYSSYLSKNAFGDDYWGKVAQELHGMLFAEGATNTLDNWAKQIGGATTNDEAMIAVMDELVRVARGVKKEGEKGDPSREITAEEERQIYAFDEANSERPGTMGILAGDEEVGSSMTIGGEKFTVKSKRDGFVTLVDGEKFGTQRVSGDTALWFETGEEFSDLSPYPQDVIDAMARDYLDIAEQEGYEDHREYDADDRERLTDDSGRLDESADQVGNSSSSGSGASPQGSPQGNESTPGEAKGGGKQVKVPASKLDIRNADSKELFSDDGGFALTGDKTQDGDKIAAERKAKEEAQAAMDAAQGNLFGNPPSSAPTLSAAEQKAADVLKGLFAAELPQRTLKDIREGLAKYPGGSYNPAPIPRSGTVYPSFRLREKGVTLYVKSKTGALFPDGHEILLTGQAPQEIPPGGGAFWNRLRDGGRRNAILDGIRQSREGSAEFRELAKIFLKSEGSDRTGSVADTWEWILGTLNSPALEGMDMEVIADQLPVIFGLDGVVSEEMARDSYLYIPVDAAGTVLAMDQDSQQWSFGRKPTQLELVEARKAHEADPSGLPMYAGGLPAEYTRPIPQDRFMALMDAANSLFGEGVDTPQKLAKVMQRLAPDNKAVPFTQSFWFSLKAVGAKGAAEPEWAEVYGKETEPEKKLTYEQFKKEYEAAFKRIQKSTLDQAESANGAEDMAKLADKYPEFLERFEAEMDEAATPSAKQAVMTAVSKEAETLARAAALKGEKFTRDQTLTGPLARTLTRKEQDEAIEAGITAAAHEIAREGMDSAVTYQRLLRLYENQPSLNAKTSTSKINQAYSTPAPMAFVAGEILGISNGNGVLVEPTSGHGMLVMGAPSSTTIYANEIDPARRSRTLAAIPDSVRWNFTGEDATSWTAPEKATLVISNPPFGSVMAEDGSNIAWLTAAGKTSSIDHTIMLKQLASMTPDGRAVFIIGGPAKTARSEAARKEHYGRGSKAAFFKYLHDNYGVVDHFTVDGDLYAKQGAGWNVDFIVIQGKQPSRTSLPAAKAPRMISSWAELFETTTLTDEDRIQLNRISEEEVRDSVRTMADALAGLGNMGGSKPDSSRPATDRGETGANGTRNPSVPSESNESQPADNPDAGRMDGESDGNAENRPAGVERAGERDGESGSTGEPSPSRNPSDRDGGRVEVKESGKFQAEYTPFSGEKGLDTLLPKNMVAPVTEAFARIKKDLGNDLTGFVREQLGYPKGTDITKYLAGEQIDAVAAAIWNFQNGGALIIGDQTGIGKGRIAAALMKYAVNQGFVPVFMTKDPGLHDAMLTEDLPDIAGGEIIPAVMDTKLQFDSAKKRKLNHGEEYFEQIADGKLPGDSNAIFVTYSQITADDAKGLTKAERASARSNGEPPADKWRMAALRRIAPNAVFILDESHLASGQSTTGWRVADIIGRSPRVYYSSATSVKRPENMGIYFKTNVGLLTAGNMQELTELMNTGGVPAMQVVSSMLAQDGQYLRRERSFEGVSFGTQISEETADRDTQLADGLTGALREIVTVQEAMRRAADAVNEVIAQVGKRLKVPAANRAKLETVNFSSKLHNIVSQYLLAIKTQSAADTAIREIRAGKKVVVALQSTMESAIDGLEFGGFDMSYKGLVLRYLDQMRFLKSGNKAFGRGEVETFEITEEGPAKFRNLSDRDLAGMVVVTGRNPETGDTVITINEEVATEMMRRAMWDIFERSREAIDGTDFGNLPISPIDAMRQAVERAGIRTGEITGRKRGIDENGEIYNRSAADTSKPARRVAQAAFNNENLDFLVINQSGSTGISLHASAKAANKATRVMIVAQPNLDINEFMQTLGRIHRSGQVVKPEFILLQTALPAEKRPAAILGRKMAMLNANTTSNAKTDVSEGNSAVDIFNQYGDEIAYRVLERDADLQRQLRPLGSSLKSFFDPLTGKLIPFQDAQAEVNEQPDGYIARTITGYLAILPVEEQNGFWEKTIADYEAYISYLDQIGQNALVAKAVDLKAKTVSSEMFTPAMDGDSAFAAPSYVEKVETKVGRKPLSGDAALEIAQKGKAEAREKMNAYVADADKAAETLASTKSKRALKPWSGEKRAEFLANQKAQRNVIANAISLIGRFGNVSRDDGAAGLGVIEEIKMNEDSILTPSKQIAVIRVNDSRETIKVPVSQLSEAFTPAPAESAKEWDESTDVGGEAAIVTGNLMMGMKALGGSGKVITYTTENGETHMGILLPKSFLAKRQSMKSRKPVRVIQELARALDAGIRVANGDRTIKWTKGSELYSLAVPAARATGGTIWRNPALNRISVGGEFTQVSNEMRATFRERDVQEVLDMLIAMGETFSTDPDIESSKSDGSVHRISKEKWIDEVDSGTGLQAAPLPALRADSPEWKAMSKEERMDYLRRKKAGTAEFSIGQDGSESPESPYNLYGTYRYAADSELAQWEKGAVRNAERTAGRGNVRAVRFEPETSERITAPDRFTKELFSLFRKRVAFVSQEIGVGQLPFDGLVHSDNPNTIIIDAESRQGMSFLLGHELGHSMQHQQPDLYNALRDTLLGMAKNWDDYRQKLKKLGYDGEDKSKAKAAQDAEFVNDFIGSQFTDPDFWKELKKRDSKVFSKLVSYALNYLKGIGEKIGVLPRDVRPYFDNIEAARAELVKALEAYQRGDMPDQSVRKEPLKEASDDDLTSPLNAAPLTPGAESENNVTRLRMEGRRRINQPMAEEARKQQELFREDGKVVGAPRLANPGDTDRSRGEQDIVDALYEHDRAVREDRSVIVEARRRMEEDPRGVEEKLLQAAYGDGMVRMDDSDHVAARLLINQRAAEAGNDLAKHEANMALRMAYRMIRADTARELRIGRDLYKTPEERALEYITDAIYQPTLKVEKKLREENWSPQKKREYVRAEAKARIAQIEKALKGMGVTLDEITSGQAFLSLSQEQILKASLALRTAEEQYVIKLIQKKWPLARIRKATGFPDARIQEINAKLYAELMEKAREKARAGVRLENYRDKPAGMQAAPLNAAPVLTEEEIEAEARRIVEVGFGISPTVAEKTISKRKTEKEANEEEVEKKKQAREKRESEELTDEEKAELEQEAVNRTASRWIAKLTESQSDTLAWKEAKKRNELDELIRKHIKKSIPAFRSKAIALGATPEQARLLDGTANEERRRLLTIRDFRLAEKKAKWEAGRAEREAKAAQRRAEKKAAKADAKADRNALTANWARPVFTDGLNSFEFDTKDRAEIMQRAQAIRDIAAATGKISTLTGKQKEKALKLLAELNAILGKYGTDAEGIFASGKPVDDYRFDIRDRAHVAAVARAIRAVDADVLDKGIEWTYSAILGGLQTMVVNAGAAIPAGWDMTMGRAFEASLNLVFKDPMAASFGEAKYILKAAGPTLARAWGNAAATWGAELPMFDEDFLGRPADLDKLFDGKAPKMGVISGKKGRIIRIPTRMLMATDDFNRTAIAVMEVGAMAYRLARAQGMKPGTPEFDRFLKIQVNTPGSFASKLAAEKASRLIFTNALPGQKGAVDNKTVPIEGLGDIVGAGAAAINRFVTQEVDSLLAKSALAFMRLAFVPFQRTPFNLIRRGVRHTLNPISLLDIAFLTAKNSFSKDTATGKWGFKWNVDGRQAEIIERASQQLQGGMLMLLLYALAAGDGDDDDLEKWMLITGTQPWQPKKKAELAANRRMGVGAYRVSFRTKNGKERFGFNYGRIEPLGTTLGLTVDSLANLKRAMRGGKSYGAAALSVFGGTLASAQEKTYLAGLSDFFNLAMDSVADDEFEMDARLQQFAASRVGMVIPNFIKQPIRETDPYFRDKAGSFIEEMFYQAVPAAGIKEERITPYGEKEKKTGTMLGRMFDVTDGGTSTVNPIDAMLLRYENKNPGEGWFPSDPTATYTDPRTGEQDVKMTPGQRTMFREMAGKRAVALLKREALNLDNPTERDKDKAKAAFTRARADAKKLLLRNPAWLNKQ